MDQANDNSKVNINSLVNSIILQAIVNSGSQSLLYGEGNTKPPPEDIEKMLENLSAIGLDDSQLPFPAPKESSNGLSLSPANDFLQTFQYFKEEVIQIYKNKSCLMDEFHARCESYFRDQYKKKGIHNFCQDYKRQYLANSFHKRDEIDQWLYEQWSSGKYSLEHIRLFVEYLSLYCKNKEQAAYSDSDATKRKIEESIMPGIEDLTQEWKKMNIITRLFKGKKIFNAYASTLSDYYLQELQIESNECLSSFFHMIRDRLEHLQTVINTVYEILNGNDKQSFYLLGREEMFSSFIPMIEEEHLSLSDMGMSSMTEVLNSLQQTSYPEGNERIQNLKEKLSHIVINKYLYQLIKEHELTIDIITDDMGVEYTPDKRILLKAPQNLESYYIPNSVVSISDSAFSNVTSLEYIKIPEGVCSIGESAFQGCSNLKEIILPKSVIQIGKHAFCGCTQLENATFLYQNISLNDELFKDCPALRKERIQTYNSVISGWMFDTENRSGTHKATGIELRYCYDNEDGTIRTELVGYPTHVSNLHAQGYSEEEIHATFREIGREFVLICKSLY